MPFRLAGGLSLVFLILSLTVVNQARATVLFRDAFEAERTSRVARAGVTRSRVVAAAAQHLQAADVPAGVVIRRSRQLTLNLFHDTGIPVILESVEKDLVGSTVWYGRVNGEPRSSVTVSVKGDRISASISTPRERYEVRPLRNGLHESLQLRSEGFPPELPPLPVAMASGGVAADAVAGDSAGTWDILVAYTHVVRGFYGSTEATQALISNAIASTNTAYMNSGVTSRVRLVGTMEVNYDDQTTGFLTTLNRLRDGADGFIDSVVTQRNTLGADAVSLFVYNPTDSACGIGFLMTTPGAGFAQSAFNVTRDDCAVGNFSFAHELGHNFGLEHDRANAGPVSSYPYAFGFQDTTGLFRDIMAYNCPGGCPRVQYFSNPDVMYLARPLGVIFTDPLAADNRRALNDNATHIANWRQTVAAPVSFTDDPLVAGTTVVKAIHINELRTAINGKRVAAGLAEVVWSSSVVAEGVISAAHLAEMRTALTPALPAAPSYTEGSLAGVSIKAVHFQELRNLVR